jgi:TonB family protein
MDSLVKARQLLAQGQFQQAREEFERAQTLGEGPCGECLLGLSHVYAANKKWKQSLDTVRKAIPLLSSPDPLALAYNQLATVLVQSKGSRGLAEAEEALRQAVGLKSSWGTLARYNLAEVLLKEKRWAEAAEAARDYLKESGPNGMARKEASIVLCEARSHLPAEPPPPEKGAAAEPQKTEGEVTRPEILFQVPPAYTEEARFARVTGTVIVESIIDQEGCVTNTRVLKGLPYGLSEAAVAAMRHWVFKPATLEGRPVKVYYVLTANFGFGEEPPQPPGR